MKFSYITVKVYLDLSTISRHINKIANSDNWLCHFSHFGCLSVRPSVWMHRQSQLVLDGSLLNVLMEYFLKICTVLHMNTYVCLWQYLAAFFLEW